MYLPPLQAMHDSQTRSAGNVTVHPSAAIAPGVLLQAEQDSQIIIAANVCIGMGSVLHAYGGLIEIQEGANLGAGVLILGSSRIGSFTCIGTSSTVIDSSVASRKIVPPGSLLGDQSRMTVTKSASAAGASENAPNASWQDPSPPFSSTSSNGGSSAPAVAGKDYVNSILATLLPHRPKSD